MTQCCLFLNDVCSDTLTAKGRVNDGEDECCSFKGRIYALLSVVGYALATPVAPIIVLFAEFSRLCSKEAYDQKFQAYWEDRKCCALIDILFTAIVSPVIFLLGAIRSIFAMVFNPGIIYQS